MRPFFSVLSMFEDTRLRIFMTVACCGSFTRAAKELGITQPAVSQNVAELEKTVGEALFERGRGELRLTEAGKRLLPYVEKILYWYERTENVCIRKCETPARPVVMQLGDSMAEVTADDGEITIRLV